MKTLLLPLAVVCFSTKLTIVTYQKVLNIFFYIDTIANSANILKKL